MVFRMEKLPPSAGIGLKPDHYHAVLQSAPKDLWLEVHPENYMVAGGPRLKWLEAMRQTHALSFHGVGSSLGGAGPLCTEHLDRLKTLIDRFEPQSVSEHLAWSSFDGIYFADLLPVPTTTEALNQVCAHVDRMQNHLGRHILIENPSVYISLSRDIDEPDFLSEIAKRTGCGLLLDINNIVVSANNVGFAPLDYLDRIPTDIVGEIHLAGHEADARLGKDLLIDTHGAPVSEPVWDFYQTVLNRAGPLPTLIERDKNIPPFDELMAERNRAQTLIAAQTNARESELIC